MHWRHKARMQKVVAALPAADAIYYALQRTAGSLRPGRSNPREWFEAAAHMAAWAQAGGLDVAGRRVLEVGTGRMLGVPMGLWLCGARHIVTVDLNKYLSRALVFESLDYLRQHAAEVLPLFGARAETPELQARWRQLTEYRGDLPGLLRLLNVEYLAPADAARLPHPPASFDLHVSHAVLEHIPAAVIRAILGEARRVLTPGGLLVHIIDPSDHFAHDDPTITAVNFLQFDEPTWTRLAGNKFMYHNRLRAYEYLDLFRAAGVEVVREEQTLDEPSLRALAAGLPLSRQFSTVSARALAVRSLNVLGRFAPAAQADAPAQASAVVCGS